MKYANMTMMENPNIPTEYHRKAQEQNLIKEGMSLWNQRKQQERMNKLKEQREIRQMIENYWPWSMQNEQPRGFRNMYADGIYPQEDFERARRAQSPLGLGRPGGGAPLITPSGKKVVRTREDPMLRFQWSNDLRRTVDNTLRYKTTKKQQEEYRKQLDKLVYEKKLLKEKEERDAREFERKLGWSDEKTLSKLRKERDNYKQKNSNNRKLKPIEYKRVEEDLREGRIHFQEKGDSQDYSPAKISTGTQLSSLPDVGKDRRDGSATDLVPVIASRRAELKIPLGTTDVTRGIPDFSFSKYRPHNAAYLKELSSQMEYRNQKNKEMKASDNEQFQKHYSTWEGFWGRPGHGAPRSVFKKACLDNMLYPKLIPVSVH